MADAAQPATTRSGRIRRPARPTARLRVSHDPARTSPLENRRAATHRIDRATMHVSLQGVPRKHPRGSAVLVNLEIGGMHTMRRGQGDGLPSGLLPNSAV